MKDKVRRNNLVFLETQPGRIEGVEEIKKEVRRHFESFFLEDNQSRPILGGLTFETLFELDKCQLEDPFNEIEIKEEVWSYDGSKSPVQNDFSFEFLKFSREMIKEYIFIFVRDFQSNDKLTKSCTTSFIALIPKIKNPQALSGYRPICMVGCLYTIL